MYQSLGIPVHDTVLGIREGKLVCACRDFVRPGSTFYDFRNLKNSVSDNLSGFSHDASDGMSVVLADVIAAIPHIPALQQTPHVIERFWDMFVTDAFIRNINRNNTNWGVLISDAYTQLAPVYDNGNSFNNKRIHLAIHERLYDVDLLRQDALDVRSCYTTTSGKPIAPLKYIASGQNPDCTAALGRFLSRVNMNDITRIFTEIPESMRGVDIVTDEYKEYHLQLLDYRLTNILQPAYRKLQTHDRVECQPHRLKQ